MTFLDAIIISVIEGITEFLPISSTGHMMLAVRLLGIEPTEFVKSFEIAIQLGAIMAVAGLYARKIINERRILLKLFASFLPTAILGLIFYGFIKQYLLESTGIVLWSMLIGGVILFALEKVWRPAKEGSIDTLNWRKAVGIGLAQSVSMIPGVSRSAASIVGGIFAGLDRKSAVEYSFLLAIPTMAAATGLDLIKSGFNFSTNEWLLLAVGFSVAFVSALITVKLFIHFVQKHSFIPFAIYRIAIAIILWRVIG